MDKHFWMPGADRLGTDRSGGTLVAGPPRCTWHITYDKLVPRRPTFMAVMRYLLDVGHEPTIGWDPLTGKIVQFLPANRSAKALKNASGGVETNRLGDVHVQIEAFFTPGMKVKGVTYAELTDTPMVNLDKILAWTDHLEIPRVWTTVRGSRSISDWKTKAGHRGHYNVPENDHTDPVGASPRKLLMLNKPKPAPTTSEEFIVDDTAKTEIREIVQDELKTIIGVRNAEKTDTDPTHMSLSDLYTQQERFETAIDQRLLTIENLLSQFQPPEPPTV